jgi:tRNA threonylcarbamoyladenosine biosynthesis protein TsaB
MLLAIDTSTELTGLALYDANGPRAEAAWHSGRNHTAQLLPQLDVMLRHLAAPRDAISAVAVALGPGSWSGLRVGLSVAKGLAMAGGLPLLGVATLDALAFQHARPGTSIYPLIRLGRERFATALFHGDGARTEPDRNLSLAELCAEVRQRAIFCGDLDDATRRELRRTLGERALLPEPAANLRRPAFLAALAWRRLAVGERDDLVTLEPIYLGEPVKSKTTG